MQLPLDSLLYALNVCSEDLFANSKLPALIRLQAAKQRGFFQWERDQGVRYNTVRYRVVFQTRYFQKNIVPEFRTLLKNRT